MQRISPVLFFRSAALAAVLVLSACGSDAEDAAPTTVSETDNTSGTTTSTDETIAETTTTESAVTTVSIDDETTTTALAAEEPEDEIGILCSAYLQSISFGTVDEGLDTLTSILGPDAPSGVQGALETLRNPNGDVEGFFAAQNSIDGYVLPICRDRFSSAIVPAADDAAAADGFLAAVRDGDLAAAERLAPTNVIVGFDWNGFPDATSDFSADNSTVTMLLEPTVTVFCQLAGGAVEFCAFGE